MERTLKQVYCSNEYCDAPKRLKVMLNDNYASQLSEIQKIIADSKIDIKHINVEMDELFETDFEEFEEYDFRAGLYYTTVHGDGSWWLCVFSKYDCSDNFEYELMSEDEIDDE